MHRDSFVKCTRTRRIFKANLLENKASNEKILFFTFDLIFHVESPPFRLYSILKCTRAWRTIKADFLENKASSEKILFFTFDSFFHVESAPLRWYSGTPCIAIPVGFPVTVPHESTGQRIHIPCQDAPASLTNRQSYSRAKHGLPPSLKSKNL